jgi:glycosyltransferase involved in cell wall biosynthesis
MIKRYTKKRRGSYRRSRASKGGSSALISVIIPTYNRFEYLLETIKSIRAQTYPHVEIIVVNDKSTQPEYDSYDFGSDVKLVNLRKNTKEIYGYACAGHVRNEGIKVATGSWIAFCDDDDVWLPKKLELQIAALKASGCKMSCADGYIGEGKYDPKRSYKLYNAEFFFPKLQEIFKEKGSDLLDKKFPKVWNAEFLEVHNCVITSSVLIDKKILNKIGNFKTIRNGEEDYECWKDATKHTDIAYVEEPCLYYNNLHGDGRQYGGSSLTEYTIYTFWTGTNEMSQVRKDCLENLKQVSECNVVLITPEKLSTYIKPEEPLHEAYEYLSETHKADYLRTYLMNFYGGGYSDIKKTTGSWKASFDDLAKSHKWICGYPETEGGVAYAPLKEQWRELIGNGAYICKPNTPLTNEWYSDMLKVMDKKLISLKLHPAKFPRDGHNQGGPNSKYPITWNEMLGKIFHKLIHKYKEKVMNTLPRISHEAYR